MPPIANQESVDVMLAAFREGRVKVFGRALSCLTGIWNISVDAFVEAILDHLETGGRVFRKFEQVGARLLPNKYQASVWIREPEDDDDYDDGTVYDDGTTTRLGDQHYFMTTTTARSGEIMSWLEYLLQTAWTDLRVHLTSLTDEWAAMAVSGPLARHALEGAFAGIDLSNTALPFMGAMEFTFDGVPVRLIRLSFSGELAYEVYTPADYGTALWEHIVTAAKPLDIKPYGLEALASLRIEKGHVAGIDIDQRNTLYDLGLGKMASKDRPFVGKPLLDRPGHVVADRWSLVGLECLEPDQRLRGGAILFKLGDDIAGHGRGYITGVTWSTELKRYIALALFQGGLAHAGEEIVCAYPLRKELVRARIVSPHFVDPKGQRLNA